MKRTFPKSYLLDIFQKAVEHGHLLIHPINEPDAVSLRQSLYRLTRRSDQRNQKFITPEMELVTVGQWRPDSGGTLPIYHSTTDEVLPTITPSTEPPPLPVARPNYTPANSVLMNEDDDFEANAYVQSLLDKAHKQENDNN